MKSSRQLIILIGILVLGVFLRALYLSEIAKNPDFSNPGVDAGYHDYWARGLSSGNWTPPELHADPEIRTTPYFRPPGYPHFLALVYWLTGSGYLAVRIVQMLLGVVTCLLAFHLGKRWFGGGVGLVFAALMSTYWVFIYFEGELLEPVLLVGLGLLLIYTLGLWTEKITFRRSLGTGLVLGLFALVRPNVLLFGLAALAWALWIVLRRNPLRRFGTAAVGFILGALLVIAPATIRNYVVAHEFVVISSNAGINLFIGNNEFADGFCTGRIRGLGTFETCFDYPQIVGNLEKQIGRRLKHSEVSAYFTDRAIEYIRTHPLRVLSLTWKRALLFWGPREVSHNKEVECERMHSKVLRNLPVNFPIVLSLSVLGIALLFLDVRRRGEQKEVSPGARQGQYEVSVLVLLFIGTYFASYLLFFVAARYRVPIVPFLLLFGSYGLYRAGQFVSARRLGSAACCLLLWLSLYGLAAVNFIGYEPKPAKWHFDRGVDYGSKGQIELAIHEYSEAVRIEPGFSQAHSNLGLALTSAGKLDEAIVHYSEALRIRHDDHWAHYGLGLALAQQGKIDEAIREYEEAIRLEPNHAGAHYELGVALVGQGKTADAISHFSETLRINPNDDRAHYGLAIAFEVQGRPNEAVKHYYAGLRVNPNARMHNRLGLVLSRQAKLDEAIREYRKAVRMEPDNPVFHYNLGVALAMQDKTDEAIKHYTEAVRVKPDYTKAHNNLAISLYFKGNYAEAWKEVRVCRKYGGNPHPDFLRDLSRKMPEPKE